MRAFLREPSTPWIVFDREGRPPSQLAVGEVLPVALSSVIPDHGFFPATAIIDAHPLGVAAEPSSLAVAADLDDDDLAPLPPRRRPARLLAMAIGAALSGLCGFGIFALSASTPERHGVGAAAHGVPVAADLAPPDLDVKAAPVAPPKTAPASLVAVPTAEAKRFGRLSITGQARGRDVFLDGKRLLGHGARSFTVTCGTHTISVGTRSGARDVDVPCNAELVLSK